MSGASLPVRVAKASPFPRRRNVHSNACSILKQLSAAQTLISFIFLSIPVDIQYHFLFVSCSADASKEFAAL